MATFQPADNLRSRTFIGLLIAQFFAAFNDQAIHASAMFFAINQQALTEAQAISLMPILFYAPWAIFCTLAGYLADRYSKRNSLIFWKFAEVLITLIALAGFWLGTRGPAGYSRMGPWIVLSTVFLMGMHSAFFVPAKYGVMPEILQARLLSRGNGLLESLSFLAIILGTVFGGVLSYHFRGQEYIIGLILTGLAVIGAGASLLIQHMPAANPFRGFPPYLYQPLFRNIRALLRSRPLALAVVGIAFFTFIVAFMRATVYMHGESQLPRWSEEKTSLIVGMVALGIGVGSPLVGFLSGGKVELGLVPVGALGMILATGLAAFTLGWIPGLIGCIILIGFFTGFYIVPLFTLLQHRAPRVSKGDSIATSNFINVTGAIIASLVFFGMDWAARQTGLAPELPQEDVRQGILAADPIYSRRGRPVEVVIADQKMALPALGASTLGLLGSPTGSGPILAAATVPPGRIDIIRVRRRGQPNNVVLDLEEGGLLDTLIDPFKERPKWGDEVIESVYKRGNVTHHRIRRASEPMKAEYDKHNLPRLLFLSAGAMTLITLLALWWNLPDLFYRMCLWFRWAGRAKLEVYGMHHLPDNGPVLLVTSGASDETCLQILSATDRTTWFVMPSRIMPGGRTDRELERAAGYLRRKAAVGLSLPGGAKLGELLPLLNHHAEVGVSFPADLSPDDLEQLSLELERRFGRAIKPVVQHGLTVGLLLVQGDSYLVEQLTEELDNRFGHAAQPVLRRGVVVGLSLATREQLQAAGQLYEELVTQFGCPVLPVYTEITPPASGRRLQTVSIVVGEALAPGATPEMILETIRRLREEFQQQRHSGALHREAVVGVH